ncbi:MAG: tRNA glutamyl-Q(34) synthetase GluQRS [Methylobacillus sp.]|jgi:glutamyl-Q tRNA(Asp) synthetase|nr:tRNA glutamyl-Q(34) synthetase GluQRS [Methylobacillus sp.]
MSDIFYRGRFAPSPTGLLHFGSLVTAVGSYLEAKSHHGEWRVRIEDLDPPREMPGATDGILRTLETCGFAWDGVIEYQSRRGALYESALEKLKRDGLIYPCACTRKEIADSAISGIEGFIYPGTCRHGLSARRAAYAWRLRVDDADIVFDDAVQGRQRQNIARDIGDFVLKRADGLYAYQLAVVVDDAEQGITHVARGSDLLDSTPRQIALQRALGYSQPAYAHFPVATNAAGEKLSKQTQAAPLDPAQAGIALWSALHFLGQQAPPELRNARPDELWIWAREHWDLAKVPKRRGIVADGGV